MEASLDTDSLPFGAVVLGSSKSRNLKLDNTGDVPLQFSWQTSSFGSHISITPTQGKVAPGCDVTFVVTFKPQCLHEDIRQDNICLSVIGMGALLLMCTGACVPQPLETIQTIDFFSTARFVTLCL